MENVREKKWLKPDDFDEFISQNPFHELKCGGFKDFSQSIHA
jgi:hypothetical protein